MPELTIKVELIMSTKFRNDGAPIDGVFELGEGRWDTGEVREIDDELVEKYKAVYGDKLTEVKPPKPRKTTPKPDEEVE